MYKAINIDTDKALKAIEEARKYQLNASMLRAEKERSYMEGLDKGLNIAEGLFRCSNYEKQEEPAYTDGIIDTIYELGKELDVTTKDIVNNVSSVDEVCALLADRIRERLRENEIGSKN